MVNRVASASMAANPPLENIINTISLPRPLHTPESLLAPPPSTSALGRALQTLNMSSAGSQDGSPSPSTHTPLGSNPSTAPGSHRL